MSVALQCEPKNRILSLDVFRGLTIVLMILVNSPGNQYPYLILEHAGWNGCTLADLVFPSFLFIVGITLVVSLRKQLAVATTGAIYLAIIKRSIILFALGLFLNEYPFFPDLGHLRIYGILQRIALCYFFSAIIYLNTRPRTQGLIFAGILIGYWLLMTQIPVPGFGVKQLTMAGSWVSYVDQLIVSSNHLYTLFYDPEGFLSTVPAIATTLFGVLIGSFLFVDKSKLHKFYLMLSLSMVLLIAGWTWSFNFPINKSLWTSSFVLWTSGYALFAFSLCYWIIDILDYTRWALPLKIFGMNALFAFCFHVILLKSQRIFSVPLKSGVSGSLREGITEYLFGHFSSHNAALAYAIMFLLLNFLVVAFLYHRKIFIKL